jgi:hypothetical protein
MANTTGWIAGRGPGLTWTTAGFTAANFNSLANGSVVVASTALVNGTNLDLYADVSFVLTVGGTTTTSSYFALYLLPLNQDGTTYGDNTANGATPPSTSYQVASAGVLSGVASGSTVVGMFRGILLPPGSYKFAITNNLGVALNATASATVNYRTYNENLNA